MKALIADGTVIQVHNSDFPVAEPWYWVDCPEDIRDGYMYEDGRFSPPKLHKPSYDYMRRYEYPSLQEQLDMLYHDIKNNNLNNGEWINTIDKVKEIYPKPE